MSAPRILTPGVQIGYTIRLTLIAYADGKPREFQFWELSDQQVPSRDNLDPLQFDVKLNPETGMRFMFPIERFEGMTAIYYPIFIIEGHPIISALREAGFRLVMVTQEVKQPDVLMLGSTING